MGKIRWFVSLYARGDAVEVGVAAADWCGSWQLVLARVSMSWDMYARSRVMWCKYGF